MPSLGADMDAGTIVEWRIAPGDQVRHGDIVAVVATDKADIDVEVFEAGLVQELLVGVGVKVPVGTALAVIGTLVGVAAPTASAPSAPPPPRTPASAPPPPPPPAGIPDGVGTIHSPLVRRLASQLHVDTARLVGTGTGGAITRADVERAGTRHRASPRARRLASDTGVDLGSVVGSGPGGAVVGADVLAASPPAPPAAPGGPPVATAAATPGTSGRATKDDRAATMRLAIARLMARSAREIPHYYLTLDVDVGRAMRWLAAENEARPVTRRLLPAALLVKATALAASEVPGLNGWWEDEAFHPASTVDLGVAVSLRSGGLIAPAIHDAAALSLDDLMAALRDVVTRARGGHLRGSELNATITVTNLGDLGADSVHGVIYPPQVALVGFGRITERAWAEDGMVGARPVVTVTLAADHRASDGMQGARFLDAIACHLHEPEGC